MLTINCRLKNPWNEKKYSAYMTGPSMIILSASGESCELANDGEIDHCFNLFIRQLEQMRKKAKKKLSDEKQKIKKGMEEERKSEE